MCEVKWDNIDTVDTFKSFVSDSKGYILTIDDDLPAASTPTDSDDQDVKYGSLMPLGFQTKYKMSKNSVAIYNHLHFKVFLLENEDKFEVVAFEAEPISTTYFSDFD